MRSTDKKPDPNVPEGLVGPVTAPEVSGGFATNGRRQTGYLLSAHLRAGRVHGASCHDYGGPE